MDIQKCDLHLYGKYNEKENELEFSEENFDIITKCCNFFVWKIRKYGDLYTAKTLFFQWDAVNETLP
jgi:hypothetical protein